MSHPARRGLRAILPLLGLLAAGCSTTLDVELWEGPDPADEGDDGEDADTGPDDDTGSDDDGTGDPPTLMPACDLDTTTNLLLDPGDSNALVSPARARAAILAGDGSLLAVPIRPNEFLNYYSFDYPVAEAGQLSVTAGLFQADLDPDGEWVLQVAVSGELVADSARPPLNVVMILDASSSTSDQDLALVKQSATALAARLRPGDRFSLVRLGQELPAVLDNYEVQEASDPVILDAVGYLQPSGAADVLAGFDLAYTLAAEGFDATWLNRVVYVGGDHEADVAVVGEIVDTFAALPNENGIYLIGAGVGDPGNYDGSLISELTDLGRGSSVFLADAQEAWLRFDERFMSTMAISAGDLRLSVELPPGFHAVGATEAEPDGYPPPEDPAGEDLAANRPLVIHERLETCAPEVLDANSEIALHLTWIDPMTFEPRELDTMMSFAEAMQSGPLQLHKGRAVHAYADALIAWQLAEDEADQSVVIQAALAVVEEALALLPEDAELEEIATLLTTLSG